MPAVFTIKAPSFSAFTACVIGTVNVQPFSAYSGLTRLFMTLEGSGLRYRLDGVTAHSATGHLFNAGDSVSIEGADIIQNLKALSPNGTGTLFASLGS